MKKVKNPFLMQYGGFVYVWAFCRKCWRWHRKSSKIGQYHKKHWMSKEEFLEAFQFQVKENYSLRNQKSGVLMVGTS